MPSTVRGAGTGPCIAQPRGCRARARARAPHARRALCAWQEARGRVYCRARAQ
jgi:hypothetical protein